MNQDNHSAHSKPAQSQVDNQTGKTQEAQTMNASYTQDTTELALNTNVQVTANAEQYNLQVNHFSAQSIQITALQEELKNPLSLWQELRFTAMSGTDYVFVPHFIYQAFGQTYPISRFMAELNCAFDLDISRIQIVCIDEQTDERSYCKTAIEWFNGDVNHVHQEVVTPSSNYFDFIDSIYEHSSTLMSQLEH